MPASVSDYFNKVGTPGSATFLASPGHSIGGTSFTVDSTSLWPTDTAVTFGIDTTSLVSGVVTRDTGSYTVWRGVVSSGTTITNCVLVYGTDQNYTAGTTTRVYILPTTSRENRIIDGLLVEHSQTGVHAKELITSRTEDTSPDVGADFLLSYDTSATSLKKVKPSNLGLTSGWIAGQLPAVSSVTENGNRSADITFASTVASILTPGMKIRTSRTVAAPTYMGGAFNGTNHYFTKVTPTSTLSTITDNFTLMAHVEPTAYNNSYIIGRADASENNEIGLYMSGSGTIVVIVRSGGVANYRYVETYQSLSLNKKTHVAATWASGTVLVYLDGVSVPVKTAVTNGTAPTAAGTGGDFSVGRAGAAGNYWTGYISGVGVFNAVLSAATIRSYKNQVLSGSETNCIGAWSLNNTGVNQQAAGTNDLTATNSVGYTARSPYCTDANGTSAGTYDWAIVTKVSTTTATVQYPEGCAIPTSGGISTVDYSGVKAPFGMPIGEDRWEIISLHKINETVPIGAINLWTNSVGHRLTVPVGKFKVGYEIDFHLNSTVAGIRNGGMTMYVGTALVNAVYDDMTSYSYTGASVTDFFVMQKREKVVDFAAQTTCYLSAQIGTATGSETWRARGDVANSIQRAITTYL